MVNLPGCIVLPPGVAKIFQVRKIQRYNKFDTVISEVDIQLSLHELLKMAKFSHFAEKIVFWSTLEAPREKMVHLRELVISFKVVVNNIVDIINFDQNTVRSNLKEVCKI